MKRITNITHDSAWKASFRYDANGNRTNLIYPGGLSVGYAYDAENRLIGVTANHAHNAKHFTFAYDGASRLTGLSYPNGVHSTFGYNAEGQVTNFTYDGFIRRQNTRNALGFKTTETINAGLAPQSPPARQLQKTHNAANQLTGEQIVTGSVTSQLVYAYDDNGCLKEISKNPGPNPDVTYTYDYENRLSSVQSATSAVHYQYDTEGARIARTCNGVTTYFIPDPVDGLKRPLAEADAQGNITRYYVWSGARLLCHIEADDGTPRYYHSDELGSTLALTDDYGVTDRFAYMPYGTATHSGSTQTPFLWLGGYGVFYDDAADLHLTVHRAYSPRLKRFIQPDPLGIDGGPNVYMWANMNPLMYIDPLGLCKTTSENTERWQPQQFYWEDGSKPARYAQADNLLTSMGAPAPYGFDNTAKAKIAATVPAIIGSEALLAGGVAVAADAYATAGAYVAMQATPGVGTGVGAKILQVLIQQGANVDPQLDKYKSYKQIMVEGHKSVSQAAPIWNALKAQRAAFSINPTASWAFQDVMMADQPSVSLILSEELPNGLPHAFGSD